MKKVIKFCFKYGSLVGYLLLSAVLIIEACLPGNISASHSNTVGDIVNDFIDIDFDNKHEFVNPTEVKINMDTTNYAIGDSVKVNTKILPADSSNKSLVYSVSDSNIATISSSGVITFINEGDVVVTVQIKDTDLTDSITLTAEFVTLDSFVINTSNETHEIEVDSVEYLSVSFNPSNVTDKTITWSSSDESIAVIDQTGKITPQKEGTVTFTATSSNSIVQTITFEIIPTKPEIKPSSLELLFNNDEIKESINLVEQNNYIITYIICPEDVSNKHINFSSSDESILTINNNGEIQTHKNGTVTITATPIANSSLEYTFDVYVDYIQPSFNINSFNDNNKLIPNSSYTIDLNIDVLPINHTIKYDSSNNSVCSVNEDGTITTHDEGTCVIKVICEYGDKKEIKEISITVENEQNTNKLRSFYLAIRKGIGHFGAFFVLAVCAAFVVIFFFKRKVLTFGLSLVAGFLVAFITELIQLFVPGRSGALKDVGIDFFGYLCGTILVALIYFIVVFIRKKRREKKNRDE